jgi:hypothetical protein
LAILKMKRGTFHRPISACQRAGYRERLSELPAFAGYRGVGVSSNQSAKAAHPDAERARIASIRPFSFEDRL